MGSLIRGAAKLIKKLGVMGKIRITVTVCMCVYMCVCMYDKEIRRHGKNTYHCHCMYVCMYVCVYVCMIKRS